MPKATQKYYDMVVEAIVKDGLVHDTSKNQAKQLLHRDATEAERCGVGYAITHLEVAKVIDIDIGTAKWRLTERGERLHQTYPAITEQLLRHYSPEFAAYRTPKTDRIRKKKITIEPEVELDEETIGKNLNVAMQAQATAGLLNPTSKFLKKTNVFTLELRKVLGTD